MAIVYKGIYSFNTSKGKYLYLYFEGDDTYVQLNPSMGVIQGSCVHAHARVNGQQVTYWTTLAPSISIKNTDCVIAVGNLTNTGALIKNTNTNEQITLSYFFGNTTSYGDDHISEILLVRKATNGNFYYTTFQAHSNMSGAGAYTSNLIPPSANTFGLTVMNVSQAGNYTGNQIRLDVPTSLYPVFRGSKPYLPTNDPYAPGDVTDKDGGNGDFDDTSDPVDIPPLPTISAVDTGFMTLFNPSLTDIKSLASYMWSDPLFDVNAYKKILANPMDAILGLAIVPCTIPASTSKSVTVGNLPTGVSMPVCDSQYIEVDCGSITVNEHWGAYLDYSPYTKAELYLPYCGIHPIDIDDIMGKTVHVVYHVDILTGACIAYVKCGDSVLYSYIGQCSTSIPVTGTDWTNMVNGVLNATTAIGSMAATGGLTAPMAVSTVASTVINTVKPSMERSGSLSGTGGMMGNQTPYLILTRPRQALPELQNHFIGYPSFITAYLGDLTGYTEVESIHLEGITATEAELKEIESILKGGVIL